MIEIAHLFMAIVLGTVEAVFTAFLVILPTFMIQPFGNLTIFIITAIVSLTVLIFINISP